MTIELNAETEALIRTQVGSGAYPSVDQFVQEAVRRLSEQESWLDERSGGIRQAVDDGWNAAQRGELRTPEQVRSRLQEHKEAWRNLHL